MNSSRVLNLIQEGQIIPDKGEVFSPEKLPIAAIIFVFFYTLILSPAICIGYYSLFLPHFLETSNIWSIYTNYPFLIIPPFILPFLLAYLVWFLEKRDRDAVLVLLPEGLIQYKPWSNERKRRATVIEYKELEKIILKTRLAGNILNIYYKSRKNETLFITQKYKNAQEICQKVINAHSDFTVPKRFTTEDKED